MSDLLSELLSERSYLLADGATGTNMMDMGLSAGQPPDLWNLEAPEKVARLHESFLEVGSDIILTNTFSANRFRLRLHSAEERSSAINEAGASIARAAKEAAGRPVVVAGSMGPLGELMVPHGRLTKDSAEEAFAEQAIALSKGGVDLLWIETIFAFDELEAALVAAASTGLPVASTMSFDTAGRTMMGISPEQASEFLHSSSHPLVAYGANCGAGPAMLVDTICKFSRCAQEGDVIIAKGNCGVPKTVKGEVVYSGDDETMARYARLARDAGARIIGGCCGTSPARLKAIAAALDGYVPSEVPEAAAIEAALGPITRSKRRERRPRARTR
ncbi:MAG: betaine--homocysteine S-methyltransferase [Deltaproteobacteria bacterium]|nr:betaine--homocysteine S-methyltransferase [Deltaproteobacteria bacterium]